MTAEITTDASPWGLGGVLRLNGNIAGAFAEQLSTEILNKFNAVKGDPKHTTLWEGLALLVAFRLWLPGLGFGAVVRVKSDSLSSLLMLSKGKAKSLAELLSSGDRIGPGTPVVQADLPGAHPGSHKPGGRFSF